eukprot:m.11481 g.11481  ORF g.11481 m.11481 type:complete len:473 (+) comp8826_c0_seq1:166-1584(+)
MIRPSTLLVALVFVVHSAAETEKEANSNEPDCSLTNAEGCFEFIPPNPCSLGGIQEVVKLKYKDARTRVKAYKPTVLLKTGIVKSLSEWTPAYLSEHGAELTLTSDKKAKVPMSFKTLQSKTMRFLYAEEVEAAGNAPRWHYSPTVNVTFMTYKEFEANLANEERDFNFYIQGVVANGKAGIGALGEKVVEDVKKMKWEIPTKIDKTQFSKAVSTLWMGPRGTLTPVHMDHASALLAQVQGTKCALFIPNIEENWVKMNMYPLFHPNKRQARLRSSWDFQEQKFDVRKLPKGLKGVQVAHVQPGEVLYIPGIHWHEVASVREDPNSKTEFGLSMSFHSSKDYQHLLREKRIFEAIQCEDKLMFDVGAHDYGDLMKTVDDALNVDQNVRETIQIFQDALKFIEEKCGDLINPVLKENETFFEFLEIFYGGRFLMLMQYAEDEESPPWDHVKNITDYYREKAEEAAKLTHADEL